MALECCGQEMLQAGDWYHCLVCGRRLRAHPHGQDKAIIAEMVLEEVQSNLMTWQELRAIIHELWRAGHDDEYEPKIPEEYIS